jgi:hypothetical protein
VQEPVDAALEPDGDAPSANSNSALRTEAGHRAQTAANSAAPSAEDVPSSAMKTTVGTSAIAAGAASGVEASTTVHSGRTVRNARR